MNDQKAGEVWEARLHTVGGGNVEQFSHRSSHQKLAHN